MTLQLFTEEKIDFTRSFYNDFLLLICPNYFFSWALSKIFVDSFNTIYFYVSEPETWFLLICMCQFWWIIFLYKVIFKAFFTFYRTLFFSTKISIFLTLSQDWLWFFALVFCSCFCFLSHFLFFSFLVFDQFHFVLVLLELLEPF